MANDPFANENGESSVPVMQDGGQPAAVFAPKPRDEQGPQRLIHLGLQPVDQHIGVRGGNTEAVCQLLAFESLPEMQVEQGPIPDAQACRRTPEEIAQLGHLRRSGGI